MTKQLPTIPVVVIHVVDEDGLALCCGLPWRKDPAERKGDTLWFCTGCANSLGLLRRDGLRQSLDDALNRGDGAYRP